MDNSGSVLRIHFKYDKVGLDIESSLPTKNCSTIRLQTDKEKYALLDAYKRVILDEPIFIEQDSIVGTPELISADFENGKFRYESEDVWVYSRKEPTKFITNNGITLCTYIKNEKEMEEKDLEWNSVLYKSNKNNSKYRLIETYLRKLYQGVCVRYIDCGDSIKITLDFNEQVEQSDKDAIFLVFSIISELVFTNCNTFIMCKDIKSIVGVDVFRKLKRIINSQSCVVQCIFV